MDSHLPITVGMKSAMQDHTLTIIVTVRALHALDCAESRWRPADASCCSRKHKPCIDRVYACCTLAQQEWQGLCGFACTMTEGGLQVNAQAMSARTFTSWRQSVLMGIYKVVKDKGGVFAQHVHNYNLNFNVESKDIRQDEVPHLANYAAEF